MTQHQSSITIQQLTSADLDKFVALIKLFDVAFEKPSYSIPGNDHLEHLLSRNDFLAFAAIEENGNLCGGLTAYILTQYYSTKPLVYIYDVAVRQELHRKGIGRALINKLAAHCKKEEMEEMFVQAEWEDEDAIEFYKSTGGLPQQVVHFNYQIDKQD